MKHRYFAFLIAGIIIQTASAQLALSGEVRPRAEYRHGYRALPNDFSPAILVSQRTRLNTLYNNENLQLFVGLQDVRIWGEQKQRTHKNTLGLSEAWASLKLNDYFKIKFGRQGLVYDNLRLFATNNWIQQGQFHDAALLNYKKTGFSIDLVGAYNQNEERLFGTDYSNFAPNYKTLSLLHINKSTDSYKISLIGVADGHQKELTTNTIYMRLTYGAYALYAFNPNLKLQMSAYHQSGQHRSGRYINAYYHSAEISQRVSKLNFKVGYEYFSGNDGTDTLNKMFQAFDFLYGVGHLYNGYMDYFTNIPLHTKNAGLINPYFKISYQVNETFTTHLDYHYFRLQNNLIVQNKPVEMYLGSELDLTFRYKINKDATLDFGYSVLFPTSGMEALKGGNKNKRAEFAFIMLTVKPTLFVSEKK